MGFAFRYPRIIAMECDVCRSRWLDRPEARLLLELSLLGRLLRPRTDFHTCDRVTSSVHVCCSTINCASYGHDLRGSFYWLIPPSNFERMRFSSRRNSMFVHSFFLGGDSFEFYSWILWEKMMKGIKFFLYLME